MLIKDVSSGQNIELQGNDGNAFVAMKRYDTGTMAWVAFTGAVGGGVATDVNVTNASIAITSVTLTSILDELQKEEAQNIDEASSTVTYIGLAAIGTSGASALWKIKKISISGAVTTITWADGNDNYDNVWNNRASLSYS